MLALGEALVEFMPARVGETMCGAFHFQKYAGGAPATYAAAIVRFGGNAGLISRVGEDPFSTFLIEALIAEAGGFEGLAAGAVAELSYWRLTGAEQPGEVRPISDNVADLVAATDARLRALIAAFDQAGTPYYSRPRPHPSIAPKYSDYDHLARVAEWSEFAPEDAW